MALKIVPTRSLKNRLIWQFSGMMMGTLFILLVVVGITFFLEIDRQSQHILEAEAHRSLQTLEFRLEFLSEHVQTFSRAPWVIRSLFYAQENQQTLKKMLHEFTQTRGIHATTLVRFDGEVLASSLPHPPNWRQNMLLHPTLEKGKIQVLPGEKNDQILILVPILFHETPQGAIIAQVSLSQPTSLIQSESTKIAYEVWAKDRLMVSSHTSGDLPTVRFVHPAYPGFPLLYQLKALMVLHVPWLEYWHPLLQLLAQLCFLSLLSMGGVILLARYLGTKIAEPVHQLCQRVRAAELEPCSPLGTQDELEELAQAFDQKTAVLIKTNRQLQQEIQEREMAENKLRHYQSTLEDQVLERTRQLQLAKEAAEAAIEDFQESERKHRAIVDLAADGILTINEQGIIQSFNRASELIFGYSASEVIGKNVSCLMPAPQQAVHDEYLARYLAGGTPGIIGLGREVLAQRQNGRTLPIYLAVSEFRWQGKRFFTGIIRDISLEKEAEQKLRQAKESAEAATRAKSEFLATMSHEIRTPMNGVIGMTSLLLSTPLNEEQREYLETIRTSGESLLKIINDILDFSKIEAGKLELEEMPFSLRVCLDEVHEILAGEAQKKNLKFTFELEKDLPSFVLGDLTRLRQILLNLVGNAIKFTFQGQVQVKVNQLSSTPQQVDLEFIIHDTGIGIPENRRHRLFQSFSQVDSSTTRKYGGTGLGLAISERLVRAMKGQVWLESQEGQGTTFYVKLAFPRVNATAASLRPPEASDFPEGHFLSREFPLKVLIVEDNLINQKILKYMLEKLGYFPQIAGNGRKALQAMELQSYDLIFMDMQMPEMDGLEATQQIRQRWPRPPYGPIIIAVTANALPEDRQRCLEAGMDDYLSKPVRQEIVHRALVTWGQKQRQALASAKACS